MLEEWAQHRAHPVAYPVVVAVGQVWPDRQLIQFPYRALNDLVSEFFSLHPVLFQRKARAERAGELANLKIRVLLGALALAGEDCRPLGRLRQADWERILRQTQVLVVAPLLRVCEGPNAVQAAPERTGLFYLYKVPEYYPT